MPQPNPYRDFVLRCSALRRAILKAKDMRGVSRDVGIAITDYVGFKLGYADPSYNRLQDEFGFGRASLGRAIKELDGRFFNVVRDPGKGRNGRSRYHPIWPESGSRSEPILQAEMVRGRTEIGSNPNRVKVPSGEPELMNQLKEEGGVEFDPSNPPPEFLSIVKAYNDAKHAGASNVALAFQEYERIVSRGVSPIRLLVAVNRFRAKRVGENDPKHAQDLHRFLSQSTWIGHEADWPSFWTYLAKTGSEIDPDNERESQEHRERWLKIWRREVGWSAPLPGEPGSPFPAECIPAPAANEPSGLRVLNGVRAA